MCLCTFLPVLWVCRVSVLAIVFFDLQLPYLLPYLRRCCCRVPVFLDFEGDLGLSEIYHSPVYIFSCLLCCCVFTLESTWRVDSVCRLCLKKCLKCLLPACLEGSVDDMKCERYEAGLRVPPSSRDGGREAVLPLCCAVWMNRAPKVFSWHLEC